MCFLHKLLLFSKYLPNDISHYAVDEYKNNMLTRFEDTIKKGVIRATPLTTGSTQVKVKHKDYTWSHANWCHLPVRCLTWTLKVPTALIGSRCGTERNRNEYPQHTIPNHPSYSN